jgi:hypothetical protein
LEKAFANNPRQDWLAVRLERRYAPAGEVAKSKSVLETSLRDNPSIKIANLELGRLLAEAGDGSTLTYLKRRSTEGDNYYEAQFWHGRELFLTGDFAGAARAFASLNERVPCRFRNRADVVATRQDQPIVYAGSLIRKEEGYAFLRIVQFRTMCSLPGTKVIRPTGIGFPRVT